jgi:glycosyltransferase involved in cell wall biosynthesis
MFLNLALIVQRVASVLAVTGVRVVGPAADGIATALRDAGVRVASSADDLTVLAGPGVEGWEEAGGAAVVIAVDPQDAMAAERISAIAHTAALAGRTVAWAGVVRMGAPAGGRAVVVAVAQDRPELAALLATGPLGVALDPEAPPAAAQDERPARVLIASCEVAGPTRNGGIGTSYHSLAHALAKAGHDVTLLFTGWLDAERGQGEDEWRAEFAADGIGFELLGLPWAPPTRSPHHAVRRAYELHRWLVREHERRPFDVMHVPECLGHGAFVVTAKALGLHYHDLEIVVGVHSSTRWVAEASRESIEDADMLVTEWLERLSVERADVVLSPTAYLVDYMRERGWAMPARTFVQAHTHPQAVRAARRTRTGVAPTELVFFGRLETRKGVEPFCDALDTLVADGGLGVEQITFLGRPSRVMGLPAEDVIAARAVKWGIPWKILADLGHAEAVSYLDQAQCVAVIPSLVDNSPNTVLEATAMGLPFVASTAGGTAELLDVRDLPATTFDAWHGSAVLQPPALSDHEDTFDSLALAAAIRARLHSPNGAVRPAMDELVNDRVYDVWHRAMAVRNRPAAPAPPLPSVGAIVVASDRQRARDLLSALESGTSAPDAVVVICEDALTAGEEPLDVPVLFAPGRSAGDARRRAAEALGTEVILVLRANEDPDADLVEYVRRAAAAGLSDALTLVTRDPETARAGKSPSAADDDPDARAFVPVGGPAVIGLLYPALLVGPYAVTRAALDAAGGFAADVFGEDLDRELLSRMALAGMRIDVLPQPLATTVRDDPWSDMRAHFWRNAPLPITAGERLVRLLRPFRRNLPNGLGDLPGLLSGEIRRGHDAADQVFDAHMARQELIDAYEERITAHVELHELYETRLEEHRALGVSYEERLEDQRELADTYEARLTEQRDLIKLYEDQKEEMRRALNATGRTVRTPPRALRIVRRVMRPPIRELPARALRFARWRLELGRRKATRRR